MFGGVELLTKIALDTLRHHEGMLVLSAACMLALVTNFAFADAGSAITSSQAHPLGKVAWRRRCGLAIRIGHQATVLRAATDGPGSRLDLLVRDSRERLGRSTWAFSFTDAAVEWSALRTCDWPNAINWKCCTPNLLRKPMRCCTAARKVPVNVWTKSI